MKSSVPKVIGREIRNFDTWGWFMSIMGISLMLYFTGIFGGETNWIMLLATFFIFWEYLIRVIYGRIFKFVYYDTIIRKMYKIEVSDEKQFYVCAENEDELALYIETHYPQLEYKILNETIVESFIKEDHFR